MKKLIILLTLVAVSFSADKWEYLEVFSVIDVKSDYCGFNVYPQDGEYKKYNLQISCYAGEGNDDANSYSNALYINGLNKMGADGWELVSVSDYDFNRTYYLKRKIEEILFGL